MVRWNLVFFPFGGNFQDTPAGLVEEKDMGQEMFASWSTQNCHDLASEVYELVLCNQTKKELNEEQASPEERKW